MKLYLARHCQTNYNELKICNYDPAVDVHLTSEGVGQAKALADKLKQVSLDHIFVSELKRTQQTAEIVNAFHNLTIEVDARLNDHRSGFEGRPFKELQEALSTASNQWTARFNGGESIEDMKARVADFMNDLRGKSYDSVLIVTSQWIIYAILVLVKGISNEEAWKIEIEQGDYLTLEL